MRKFRESNGHAGESVHADIDEEVGVSMPLRRALHQLLAPRVQASRAMDEKRVALIEALREDVQSTQQMQQHQQAVHFVVTYCRQLVMSEVGMVTDEDDVDDERSSQSIPSSSNAYSYSSDRGAKDTRASLVRQREYHIDVTVMRLRQLRVGLHLLCELLEMRILDPENVRGDAAALRAAASLLAMASGECGMKIYEHFGSSTAVDGVVDDIDAALFAPFRALWLVLHRCRQRLQQDEVATEEWRGIVLASTPPSAHTGIRGHGMSARHGDASSSSRGLFGVRRARRPRGLLRKSALTPPNLSGDAVIERGGGGGGGGDEEMLPGTSTVDGTFGDAGQSPTPSQVRSGASSVSSPVPGLTDRIVRTDSDTSIASTASDSTARRNRALLAGFYSRLQPRKIQRALDELETTNTSADGRTRRGDFADVDNGIMLTTAVPYSEQPRLKLRRDEMLAALNTVTKPRLGNGISSDAFGEKGVDAGDAGVSVLAKLLIDSYIEDAADAQKAAIALFGAVLGDVQNVDGFHAERCCAVFNTMYTVAAHASLFGHRRSHEKTATAASPLESWLVATVVALIELVIANDIHDEVVWFAALGCLLHVVTEGQQRPLHVVPAEVCFHMFEVAIDHGWPLPTVSAVVRLLCATWVPEEQLARNESSNAKDSISPSFSVWGLSLRECMEILPVVDTAVDDSVLRCIAIVAIHETKCDTAHDSNENDVKGGVAASVAEVLESLRATYRNRVHESVAGIVSPLATCQRVYDESRSVHDALGHTDVHNAIQGIASVAMDSVESTERRIEALAKAARDNKGVSTSILLPMETMSDRRRALLVWTCVLSQWICVDDTNGVLTTRDPSTKTSSSSESSPATMVRDAFTYGSVKHRLVIVRAAMRAVHIAATSADGVPSNAVNCVYFLMQWTVQALVHDTGDIEKSGENLREKTDILTTLGEALFECMDIPALVSSLSLRREENENDAKDHDTSTVFISYFHLLSDMSTALHRSGAAASVDSDAIRTRILRCASRVRGNILILLVATDLSGSTGTESRVSTLTESLVDDDDFGVAYIASVGRLTKLMYGRKDGGGEMHYPKLLGEVLDIARASSDSTVLTNPIAHMRAIRKIKAAHHTSSKHNDDL